MTNSFLPVATGFCALLAFGGCASLADRIPQTVDPSLAESPYYPGGYSDGCSSAVKAETKFSTKLIRDEYLFEEEKGYAYGWRQGFAECTTKDPLSDSGGLRSPNEPF